MDRNWTEGRRSWRTGCGRNGDCKGPATRYYGDIGEGNVVVAMARDAVRKLGGGCDGRDAVSMQEWDVGW
jgi:hypothetical protein